MPMTRRALLISNPGEDGAKNYAVGVYVDIRNYQELLTSDVGGAWESFEIKHLDRPSVTDVQAWLKVFSAHDYLFVMFTGHGWYSSVHKDRILELRKGEEMQSVELLNGTRKRAVVLDCCQRVHHEAIKGFTQKRAFLSNAAAGRTPDRVRCRKLFDDGIQNAEGPIMRLLSCSINEFSTDSDSEGGYYNSNLIDCAGNWVAAQARLWGPASFDLVDSHNCALPKVRARSGGTQNPTIEKARTAPYFPFAVFA